MAPGQSHDLVYDDYGDDERPVLRSDRRTGRIRNLRRSGWVLAAVAGLLIVGVYLDAALIHHQYYFLATELYPLSIGAGIALVAALNSFFWAGWLRHGRMGRTWTVVSVGILVLLSPVAVFLLVLAMMITTSFLALSGPFA
jgi:hypothetical protein